MILEHVQELLPGQKIVATGTFVVVRDADVPIQDEDARDLLETVEEAVLASVGGRRFAYSSRLICRRD